MSNLIDILLTNKGLNAFFSHLYVTTLNTCLSESVFRIQKSRLSGGPNVQGGAREDVVCLAQPTWLRVIKTRTAGSVPFMVRR